MLPATGAKKASHVAKISLGEGWGWNNTQPGCLVTVSLISSQDFPYTSQGYP